jgi:peptidoglycan/LPS O-acetylase OafA/YrhL
VISVVHETKPADEGHVHRAAPYHGSGRREDILSEANRAGGKLRRLDFVDSLRGLAAIYVVFYHMAKLPNPTLTVPHWAHDYVINGGTAVTLFFVISAFSLCYAMNPHVGRAGEIRAFYVRRFFRIAPLFYVMIGFYLVRDVLYYGAWHSPWEVAQSVLVIFNFFPGSEQGFVWASWTIGVEMVFYAIFPLLFLRFRDVPGALALVFGCLLVAAVFQESLLYLPLSAPVVGDFYNFSFLRHLPTFAIGMLCWTVFVRYIDGRRHPAALGSALVLGSLWAYRALLHGALNVWFPDPVYWQAIIYSALLLGLGIAPSRAFVNPLTRFAGRISYSIYLLHPSAILFLFPVYRRLYELPLPVTARFLLCAALTLAVVLSLASITYRWIEQPGMRFGKRLLGRPPLTD